jgi:hypothetical protein
MPGVGVYSDWFRSHGFRHSSLIAGTVELWGSVAEHELGYRAEFARIRSFVALRGCTTDPKTIERFCDIYKVPWEKLE